MADAYGFALQTKQFHTAYPLQAHREIKINFFSLLCKNKLLYLLR